MGSDALLIGGGTVRRRRWRICLLFVAGAFAVGCWTSTGRMSDAGQDEAALDEGAIGDVPTADEVGEARVDDGDGEDATETGDGSCCTELGGPCNAVTQCGCPESWKCIIRWPDDAPPIEECAPGGSLPHLDPCSLDADECAPGSQCVMEPWGTADCLQFCYSDVDCSTSHPCELSLAGVPGYALCADYWASECDPYDATGCASGYACTVGSEARPARLCAPPGWLVRYACTPAGARLPGEDCSTEPCVVGSGCHDLGDGRPTCYRYCDLDVSHPSGCEDIPGTVCTDALHGAWVGVCMPE